MFSELQAVQQISMVAFLSSLLVVALVATPSVFGQQQAMMTSGSSRYCGYNERAISYCTRSFGCRPGAYCNRRNGVCCAPNGRPPTATCPIGRAQIGPCLNSMCPSIAQCVNNRCCLKCPSNYRNIGPCVANRQCPPPATCQNGACCQPNNGRK